MPDGWRLGDTDWEGFTWRGDRKVKLRAWGVLAEGPGGAFAVAIAAGEAECYRQLARKLRGELGEERGWAPPADAFEVG
jgi:hypothetical protein